jgi:hypothetical protein
MIHLIIGALAMAAMLLLVDVARRRRMAVRWWQWALTALGILYGVFVIELVAGFLAEGAGRAALVMGLITGIVAVIWGVLLRRFVFASSAAKTNVPTSAGGEK